jgi:hypothetical protein
VGEFSLSETKDCTSERSCPSNFGLGTSKQSVNFFGCCCVIERQDVPPTR